MKPKSIILKSKLILCTLIFATLITSACREQNLLAYGKRASCVGVHHQYTANRFASWGRDNIAPSLVLQNRQQSSFPALQPLQVQVLDPNTGEIEHNFQFELNSDIRELTMSENENIIAINKGFDVSSQIFLYTFNSEQQPAFDAVIERAARPVWHPSELLLAAIYYPEDGELASNKIALFDTDVSDDNPIQTYELEYAIGDIFGWSSNGKIMAISQYGKNGVIPYYIHVENGTVEQSLYHMSKLNCVENAQWAPNQQIIVFSGNNDTTKGWDIFLEEVASLGGNDGSLINLTNTLQEDEIEVSWAPNGEQIAFIKTYEDEPGILRQELFTINLRDTSFTPIQLTNTLDKYEANPIWISNNKIAYLRWHPKESVWSLETVSITTSNETRIMEIPKLWYIQP